LKSGKREMNAFGTSEAILNGWDFGRKKEVSLVSGGGHLFTSKFYKEYYTINQENEFLQFSKKYLRKLLASSVISFYAWDDTNHRFEPKIFDESLAPIISYQIEEGIIEWLFNEENPLFLSPERELNLFSKPLYGKLLVLAPLKNLQTVYVILVRIKP